ncbi:MAG: tryptophanyl-tRNA synthetase [Candidatus Berkelbacteria bacterium Gr01-1014_85]|uniref:Tryptophan--tRNA ligase n=1 Tax=Candidatus Berkelbacteria bacterium Gr01-1014_85 TaxID=2017150 RepID=A0A554JDH0_9BACT|nr:MAG: tryptophanyl-tRNA synthetase [Candidatus Berkelbacteria bacterium Gr01-1014_85]
MRILSGITTSGNGELHLGNYIGAIRQWLKLQQDHDLFLMLANLHALTGEISPANLKENTYKVLAMYLACGLDPRRSVIFAQSQLPQHSELAWILNNLTYMGELSRMTQFKDKSARPETMQAAYDSGVLPASLQTLSPAEFKEKKQALARGGNISVGLFTYPILQAADILLYQAEAVPVGEDQKQHLELTRDLALRFNQRYGQTFVVPEVMTSLHGARIMSLSDPKVKMSKSLAGSAVYLSDAPTLIKAKFKQAETDSLAKINYAPLEQPGIGNLLTIYASLADSTMSPEQVAQECGQLGYGQLKELVANRVIEVLTPIQERYQHYLDRTTELDTILADGQSRAVTVAAQTLNQVKDKLGLL